MCLDTVGKTVTLKKDKVVWKAVRITKSKEHPIVYNNRLNYLSKRVHISKRKRVAECWGCTNDTYIPHFHCYIKKKDAVEWWTGNGVTVLEFIIPTGTTVVFGKGLPFSPKNNVIVTPVLINPRVPE